MLIYSDLAPKKYFVALKTEIDKLDVPTSLNNLKTKVDDLDYGGLKTAAIDFEKIK